LKINLPYFLFAIILTVVLFSSCNTMKYVPKGDHLYTGPKWKVEGKLNKHVKKEIEEIPRPRPNSRILGIPYKLAFYNLMGPPKGQKGFMNKIKRFGEAPVLLSQVNPAISEPRVESHMLDYGYFHADVKTKVITKDKKGFVEYKIKPGSRYAIREIHYPTDSTLLSQIIRDSKKYTLLHHKDFINTQLLRKERERVDLLLKDKGYFFFAPDLLLYRVDTLHEGKADIYITVKDQATAISREQWTIDSITIYGNYTLQRDSVVTSQKGKRERLFTLIDPKERYKVGVYERALLIKEGQMYNRELHYLSIERLMNLNTFRFVKFSFNADTISGRRTLDTKIFITPLRKNSIRFETSVNTKTGNFVGSELALKWRNVNVNRGAEIMDLNVSAGFDAQFGGKKVQSPNAYNFKTDLTFYIPRIFPYFKVTTGHNSFIPRTGINLGAEYLHRPDLYTLRALKTSLEWVWKNSKTTEHTLRPIRLQSIYPTNITAKFDSILSEDIALRASFEKQLIIGSQYQYLYNNTYKTRNWATYWLRFNAGTSGNLFNMLSSPAVDTPGAVKFFNLPISQFIRLESDLRTYIKLSPRWTWANRVAGGVALAYGNSVIVPYNEQFFIGGSSSIRAFRIRTLGPGSYHTPEKEYQANESGDVKIEMNTEWRYDMSRYIKFAAFFDAGNIWLRKSVPDKPGSKFTKEFLKDFAVGTGFGIRLDFSVMLLRFDFSIPIRKPWYPENQKWVVDEINFGNSQWRKENLLINIAIGYPF
jgi:outer membrane protein insertion porin family